MSRQALVVAVALLAAMAAGSALILVYGESPAQVWSVLVHRTWGDAYGLGQVLFKATPLVFTGLAVAVAFRAGLFNIGAEGQLVTGSLATALVAAWLSGAPAWLALGAALVAGACTGGLAGALPGWLKARFGAHEVITTIMLNFILIAAVSWAGRTWFYLPETVHTRPVATRLPALGLAGSAASVAVLLAVLVAACLTVFLRRTRAGFELRVVGENPAAAEAGGVRLGTTWVWVMALSGALAGLVGSATVLGYKGYFEEGIGSGAGFMGIAVALLAGNRPWAVVPAALLLATLSHGGLAVNAFVPREIVDVLQAVVILAVALTAGLSARRARS